MLRIVVLVCLLLLAQTAPHVIFVMMDDVGHHDVSYYGSPIPTPHLDRLSARGIRLDQHYVQPTCTPTRAALMTGRYASSVGLPFAMFHGSTAGIPEEIFTMPEILKAGGFATHMVGKWHLGFSRWSQTPVGRGFDTHVGSMLWGMDPFSKSVSAEPWNHLGLDWIRANASSDGDGVPPHSFELEPRHATRAITEESIDRIRAHVRNPQTSTTPLFLYVAYTAAHSPLVAESQFTNLPACKNLPHLWRRQFCAHLTAMDEGIGAIFDEAETKLGKDVIFVVSSDNGGSTWFGSVNEPLRSGKTTPFEGGVRVPALVVDLSASPTTAGTYLGLGGRAFAHPMHIADWLPTLLSLATPNLSVLPTNVLAQLDFDGVDMANALYAGDPHKTRREILLEYYSPEGSNTFGTPIIALVRDGRWKYMKGHIRDSQHYFESSLDQLNSTLELKLAKSPTLSLIDNLPTYLRVGLQRFAQQFIRNIETFFGEGPGEGARVVATHQWFHPLLTEEPETDEYLFDLEADLSEHVNLLEGKKVRDLPAQVAEHFRELKAAAAKFDASPRFGQRDAEQWWMTVDFHSPEFRKTLHAGKCAADILSLYGLPTESCRFFGPWLGSEQERLAERTISGTLIEERAKRNITVLMVVGLCVVVGMLFKVGKEVLAILVPVKHVKNH